jgi:hypothetical protein
MFPSYVEQLLWRVASVITTAAMPLFLLLDILQSDVTSGWVGVLVVPLAAFVISLYVISRFILLVLPFCALRSLPAKVYQTVPWMTYILHV